MLGRKSKYEKRDYLKQFKIGKATYSESLIYEAYGGLQNDGIMLAVYYDVDAAKIIHQLDSWEKINDSPTISSILKNVSSYFGLDFVIPEIASGNFFLYDNSQHKELRSEAEMNTLLLHSEDVNFSLVVWDDEKHTIYIVAIAACICMERELISMAVLPRIMPEEEFTTDCPMSNTAIAISNV